MIKGTEPCACGKKMILIDMHTIDEWGRLLYAWKCYGCGRSKDAVDFVEDGMNNIRRWEEANR